jgi:polyhydroxyalkanoate synthase
MKDNVAAGPKAPAPVMGAPQFTSVNVEAFSKNLARMIEGGGQALAAYLKPREEGKVEPGPSDEIANMIKTLG